MNDTTPFLHRPVLLDEAIEALAIDPEGIYIDATFGRGGHSEAILERLGPQGRLVAIDKDPEAVAAARERFAGDGRFRIFHGSFARIGEFAEQAGVAGQVAGVLLDLGVSSPQLDDARRGFSFMREGPLDMRMDTTQGESAAEWLARAKESEIARVLKEYGEERFSRRIARAIVAARAEGGLSTTTELAELIASAVPVREKDKHPATRSFQAIRIHINGELDDLRACLEQAVPLLRSGGRLAVISFHSLEDRMVKRFMREQARGDRFPAGVPVTVDQLDPKVRLVGRDIRPTEAEIRANPRARSSVLRVAEKR